MSKDTSTGADLKAVVGLRLKQVCPKAGISVLENLAVGTKPNGRPNRFPFVLVSDHNHERRALVACKAQNFGGSAEEKVPFDVIRILEAMEHDNRYVRSFLVLGGTGWSSDLIDFYVGNLGIYIPKMVGKVTILGLDDLLSEKFELS